MENASKALIIAGAILLSILIIGLGMFIYNQAAGTMSGANLDPQKIQAYNSQFLQYEGKQSGSNVRSLLNIIRNHNSANLDDETLQIGVGTKVDEVGAEVPENGGAQNLTKLDTLKKAIKAGKSYNVTFGTDPNSGYINSVTINTENRLNAPGGGGAGGGES